MVKNNIFNQKKMEEFIKKYSDKLVINKPNEKPVENWINRLNEKSLVQEKQNYFNFKDIILQNILGYELEDIEFEHAHDDGRPVEFTLMKDNKEYVIIEAKGTNTDLDKRYGHKQSAVEQATNYASVREDTKWAVVTNYDEIRLFNPSSREKSITFHFKELTDKKTLKEFLLTFSKFSLIDMDIPKKLMNESQIMEKNFEDEFYKLFSETRLMIIKELMYSGIEKIEAIRYSQLILDRFIFICFAEDRELLPAETSTTTLLTPIINKNLLEFTLWDRINELFRFVDIGNQVKNISGFNGGLFNENLRNLQIRDFIEEQDFYDDCKKKWKFKENNDEIEKQIINYKDILNPIYKNLLIMSSFDFESEVDVNILGHIFENSIGDIEELKDQRKNRRKQDGVYYTPEFITDYICKNTIIPYLSKNGESNTVDGLIKEFENDIDSLDQKIRDIKIIDPACGSGAFLNKAADILLEIHEEIFNKTVDNTLDAWFDSITERKNILLNNIYGVDVNEESVEITKLAMFLKVAKKGIQLPTLDENIKCGNSLIDDIEVVGSKAFNWEIEFSEIFKKGGFDVVVGNPPYVNANLLAELLPHEREWLNCSSQYDMLYQKWDLYIPFIEKSLKILNENGLTSMIIPYPFIDQAYAKILRNKIITKYNLIKIVDLSSQKIFKDATVENCIPFISKKHNDKKITISKIDEKLQINDIGTKDKSEIMKEKSYIYDLDITEKIHKKYKNYKKISEYCFISKGMVLNADEKTAKGEFKKSDLISNTKTDIHTKEYIEAKNIDKYLINDIRYLEWNTERVPSKISRPTFKELYESPKILVNKLGEIKSTIDKNNLLCDQTIRILVLWKELKNIDNRSIKTSIKKSKLPERNILEENSKNITLESLVGILNSKIGQYLLNEIRGSNNKDINPDYLKEIKIPTNEKLFEKISNNVSELIKNSEKISKESISFKKWLKITYNLEELPQKVEEYYNMTFEDFMKEIIKKQKKFKIRSIQDEIDSEYQNSIEKIHNLEQKSKLLKEEIDRTVYELYELNEDEIKIIEENM